MARVLEVSPDDLRDYVPCAKYMKPVVWAAIMEGWDIVGYGCVSYLHGQAWAHDLKHWGKDATAVARLYKFLIKRAKERGVREVMTDVSDARMVNLYAKMGWSQVSIIMKGEL